MLPPFHTDCSSPPTHPLGASARLPNRVGTRNFRDSAISDANALDTPSRLLSITTARLSACKSFRPCHETQKTDLSTEGEDTLNNSNIHNGNTDQLNKTISHGGDALNNTNVVQHSKSELKSSERDRHARTKSRRVRKLANANRAQHRREFSRTDRGQQVQASNQPIETVSDIVARVEKQFEGKLVFALNRRSFVKGNPFEETARFWLALHCLGTEVYEASVGELSAPQLDLVVREACGWKYSANQGKDVKQHFQGEYTTRYNGKTYEIDQHLKWGVGRDSRKIMRIAFAVDKRQKLIIVGYIGPHQRTRRS